MEKKTRKIIGWILSGIVLLFMFGMGVVTKFIPSMTAQFSAGFPNFWAPWVYALVIMAGIVLYLIPKTQVIGFAVLTSYMSAAAALVWHLMSFADTAMIFAAIVMLWIGQAMLRPSLLTSSVE